MSKLKQNTSFEGGIITQNLTHTNGTMRVLSGDLTPFASNNTSIPYCHTNRSNGNFKLKTYLNLLPIPLPF